MSFNIKMRETQGVAVLELRGAFTLPEDYACLRAQVKELLAAEKKKILVDMAGLSSIDSGGIGTLVEALVSIRKWGGELKLVHVSEKIKKPFLLTNLATFFEMHASEEEALASFQAKDLP